MDAVKYLKERERMCKKSACFDCQFYEKNNHAGVNCMSLDRKCPEEAVSAVEKWSEEHPIRPVPEGYKE